VEVEQTKCYSDVCSCYREEYPLPAAEATETSTSDRMTVVNDFYTIVQHLVLTIVIGVLPESVQRSGMTLQQNDWRSLYTPRRLSVSLNQAKPVMISNALILVHTKRMNAAAKRSVRF
jgi:hypothetical protein